MSINNSNFSGERRKRNEIAGHQGSDLKCDSAQDKRSYRNQIGDILVKVPQKKWNEVCVGGHRDKEILENQLM